MCSRKMVNTNNVLLCMVVLIGQIKAKPVRLENNGFPLSFPVLSKDTDPYHSYNWLMRLINSDSLYKLIHHVMKNPTRSTEPLSTTTQTVPKASEHFGDNDITTNGALAPHTSTLVVIRDQDTGVPSVVTTTTKTTPTTNAAKNGIPIVILGDNNDNLNTERIENDLSLSSTTAPSTTIANLQIIRDTFDEVSIGDVTNEKNVHERSAEFELNEITELQNDITTFQDTVTDEGNDIKMSRDAEKGDYVTTDKSASLNNPGLLILQPNRRHGIFLKR